jgi:hypothetical protein
MLAIAICTSVSVMSKTKAEKDFESAQVPTLTEDQMWYLKTYEFAERLKKPGPDLSLLSDAEEKKLRELRASCHQGDQREEKTCLDKVDRKAGALREERARRLIREPSLQIGSNPSDPKGLPPWHPTYKILFTSVQQVELAAAHKEQQEHARRFGSKSAGDACLEREAKTLAHAKALESLHQTREEAINKTIVQRLRRSMVANASHGGYESETHKRAVLRESEHYAGLLEKIRVEVSKCSTQFCKVDAEMRAAAAEDQLYRCKQDARQCQR